MSYSENDGMKLCHLRMQSNTDLLTRRRRSWNKLLWEMLRKSMIDGWIHAFLCNMFQWRKWKKIHQENDLETLFLKKRTIHMSSFVIDFDPAGVYSRLGVSFIFLF